MILAEAVTIDGELLVLAFLALIGFLAGVVAYTVVGYRVLGRVAAGAATGTHIAVATVVVIIDLWMVAMGVVSFVDAGWIYWAPPIVHGVGAARGFRRGR